MAWSGGPPTFRTGFHVPRLTRGPVDDLTRTGLSPALAALFQRVPVTVDRPLAWSAFRSPLLNGVSVDFLSFRVLRCFTSPGSPRRPMDSAGDDPCGPGFPIRTSADQRLLAISPRLFRSCHAPSSPPCAKASTECLFEIDASINIPISARFDSAAPTTPASEPDKPDAPSEPRNPAIPPDPPSPAGPASPADLRQRAGPPASIACFSPLHHVQTPAATRPPVPPSRGADTRRTARHRPWERP